MKRADPQTGIIGGGVIAEDPRSQDLEGRLAQRSEHLYRIRLVRWFLWAWVVPGNLLLVVTTALVLLLAASPIYLGTGLAVACVASMIVSGRMLYQHHFRVRAVATEVRELQRAHRENMLEEIDGEDLLGAWKRYRTELPYLITDYRLAARRLRWKNHAVQCVVIVGSILAASVTAASMSIVDIRWIAMAISLLVAVSAALSAYARYQERGANLLRTADELEREYKAVELRVGRYRRCGEERAAYLEFAEAVETLRSGRTGEFEGKGTVEL